MFIQKLCARTDDVDVATDLGISYFVQNPPDDEKAIAALTKVSAANPTHDRSLQFLVKAYIRQGKLADAEKALAKIKTINPANKALAELTAQLSQARPKPNERKPSSSDRPRRYSPTDGYSLSQTDRRNDRFCTNDEKQSVRPRDHENLLLKNRQLACKLLKMQHLGPADQGSKISRRIYLLDSVPKRPGPTRAEVRVVGCGPTATLARLLGQN